MSDPAILVAGASIDSGIAERRVHRIVLRRVGVDLTRDLRDPEAVDDVDRFHVKMDLGVGRDVHLVRRLDLQAGVLELPPPLVPDGSDLKHRTR